jgi:hypothetical protein
MNFTTKLTKLTKTTKNAQRIFAVSFTENSNNKPLPGKLISFLGSSMFSMGKRLHRRGIEKN